VFSHPYPINAELLSPYCLFKLVAVQFNRFSLPFRRVCQVVKKPYAHHDHLVDSDYIFA
jgi:hypothetical protein